MLADHPAAGRFWGWLKEGGLSWPYDQVRRGFRHLGERLAHGLWRCAFAQEEVQAGIEGLLARLGPAAHRKNG